MYLSFLMLRDFRNYERLELSLGPGVAVFYGANASGKTNLLEACYYISALSSPRAEREADLARWGSSVFLVAARLEGAETRSVKIETSVSPSLKRKVLVDDAPAKRSDLNSLLPCVYFSPDDLYMVKRSAALRRRYLDSVLSRTDTAYAKELSRYLEGVERRNAALKRLRWDNSWHRTLESLDEVVLASGSAVLCMRLSFVNRLMHWIEEMYGFVAEEACRASYVSSIAGLPADGNAEAIPDLVEVSQAFRRAMDAVKSEERERCLSLVGPHRDDISIEIAGKPARLYGSQGQQRSAALALRMAEAKMLEERLGRKPLILLDDVFSELDERRRAKVLSLCDLGHQILITSTDPATGMRPESRLFLVKDNAIVQQR